jgi:DNA-binding GntR family transcriptional regulator
VADERRKTHYNVRRETNRPPRIKERRLALLQTEKLSDQVYRLVRDRITSGELRPGARLGLDHLVTELGVSKTPLREALSRLERERLVVTRPRSGTYVAVPDVIDIIEICELRRGIEWQAIQLATSAIPLAELHALHLEIGRAEDLAARGDYEPFFQSDVRLHRVIVDFAGNRRLCDVRDTIDSYVQWFRILGATGVHRVHGSSLRHRQIVAALLERDPLAAAAAIAVHIDEVKDWMVEDFPEPGEDVASTAVT